MHNLLTNDGCLIRVQTWDVDEMVPTRAEALIGATWPHEIGVVMGSHLHGSLVCVGPHDWILFGGQPAAALVAALNTAFLRSSYRATDVSHALERVRISSPSACRIVAKGCSLDLDLASFKLGRAARTRFAGIPVLILRIEESVFECLAARSYREYFLAWLKDAAREFEACATDAVLFGRQSAD
jgi:sarcosine oxidase, subunit gamma